MSQILAFLRGTSLQVRLAIVALALLLLLALWLRVHDGRVIDRHDAAVNLDAERKARGADNAAAGARVEDARANDEQERAYDEAIQAAPGGAPAPAAVSLGCERLRRAGTIDADLPAVCRH